MIERSQSTLLALMMLNIEKAVQGSFMQTGYSMDICTTNEYSSCSRGNSIPLQYTKGGKTYVLTDTVQIGKSTIFPFMVQVLFGYFAHMKYVLQFVPTSRQFPLFTTLMMN